MLQSHVDLHIIFPWPCNARCRYRMLHISSWKFILVVILKYKNDYKTVQLRVGGQCSAGVDYGISFNMKHKSKCEWDIWNCSSPHHPLPPCECWFPIIGSFQSHEHEVKIVWFSFLSSPDGWVLDVVDFLCMVHRTLAALNVVAHPLIISTFIISSIVLHKYYMVWIVIRI